MLLLVLSLAFLSSPEVVFDTFNVILSKIITCLNLNKRQVIRTDILNPVQWTAKGMDQAVLKERFGAQLTFWGAVVDTQKTLPFGTPDEVRAEVEHNIRTFGPGGGYVISSVHNVQPGIPVENLLALYETIKKFRDYPL